MSPLTRLSQSGFDFGSDFRRMPAEVTVAPDGLVLESSHFVKQQFVHRQSCDENTPASRTKIDRNVKRLSHNLLKRCR
jgi:hypothetical protein